MNTTDTLIENALTRIETHLDRIDDILAELRVTS